MGTNPLCSYRYASSKAQHTVKTLHRLTCKLLSKMKSRAVTLVPLQDNSVQKESRRSVRTPELAPITPTWLTHACLAPQYESFVSCLRSTSGTMVGVGVCWGEGVLQKAYMGEWESESEDGKKPLMRGLASGHLG